jgi:hypothetical protein
MDQVSVKYTNTLHCKTLQNFPKFRWIFGLKTNHLATLAMRSKILTDSQLRNVCIKTLILVQKHFHKPRKLAA